MNHHLDRAEALERRAAAERVSYLTAHGARGLALDVGCGNGYSVLEWKQRSVRAYGVDSSIYRFQRWLAENPMGVRPFVLASAVALPFRSGAFQHVSSSGMLEHIGVQEWSEPYRVNSFPGTNALRAHVVAEVQRVASADGTVIIDCPNGWFPVDFWHGDRLGAFRLHRVPYRLNPSFRDLSSFIRGRCVLLPLKGRLSFRQVGESRLGRVLAPLARALVWVLDRTPRSVGLPILSLAYPFLVVRGRGHGAA